MIIRERFEQRLHDLRESVLAMSVNVAEEMGVALEALTTTDLDKAREVFARDNEVNAARFRIEQECFALIVTQQPAARDLRLVVAVMNIIVDLERMGDQAKGIAKVIPHLLKHPGEARPHALAQMGEAALAMLERAMHAYAHNNVNIARMVATMDNDLDALYARVFTESIAHMAELKNADEIEAVYEMLRAARELERFGDLATNIAERVIYLETGSMEEVNIDPDGLGETWPFSPKLR